MEKFNRSKGRKLGNFVLRKKLAEVVHLDGEGFDKVRNFFGADTPSVQGE
jgi:hypothetical protein